MRKHADGKFLLTLVALLVAWVAYSIASTLVTARERARQKRSMSDLRHVAMAVEAYAQDTNTFPRAKTLAELERTLQPRYIKQMPRQDAYGHAFVYEPAACDRDACKRYYIASGGENGVVDEKTLTAYGSGKRATAMTSDDIVITDGEFLNGAGIVWGD